MKKLALLAILVFSLLEARVVIKNGFLRAEKNITSYIEIKNKNLVRQKEDYSCGSASLATILKYYYNYEISEKEILDMVMKLKGITKDNFVQKIKEAGGLSFLDLSIIAKTKGFKALGLALDYNTLTKLKAPVILFVKIRKNEHFTVYKGADSKNVYLADPSFGNIKVRISKFKEMFYNREDLKYPGKILAILPIDINRVKINKDYNKIEKEKNIIEEIIKMKMVKSL